MPSLASWDLVASLNSLALWSSCSGKEQAVDSAEFAEFFEGEDAQR